MRFLLCFLACVCAFGQASSYQQLSLEAMLAKAELAFYGVVLATTAIEKDGEVWTQVEFEVLEAFRGLEADSPKLELTFYGGKTETATTQVSLMPTFTEGEKLVIFAYKAEYYSPIVGFRQALWRETPNGFRSETGDLLSLSEGDLVLTGSGLSPAEVLSKLAKAFEVQE